MSLHVSLHIRSTDAVRVVAHEPSDLDWLQVEFAAGFCPIHCDDSSTADRLAQGFTELAAKMRERRGLPDPEVQDEIGLVTADGRIVTVSGL